MSSQVHLFGKQDSTGSNDLLSTALKIGYFRTLVTGLQATGLSSKLQGKGPFTMFAPTDSAFSNLAAGTLDSLMKPASRDRLAWILSCHLAEGEWTLERIAGLSTVKTLHGELVRIFTEGDDTVKIDGARVTHNDLECSNGILHVIDQVILPGR